MQMIIKELLNQGIPENRIIYFNLDKRTYAEGLIEEIYNKDIRKRVKIRNKLVFDAVMKYLTANFGATTSISNIVEDLKKTDLIPRLIR